MMDSEEARPFYHDEAKENIDVKDVLKTANSVCSLIGQFVKNIRKRAKQVSLGQPLSYLSGNQKVW